MYFPRVQQAVHQQALQRLLRLAPELRRPARLLQPFLAHVSDQRGVEILVIACTPDVLKAEVLFLRIQICTASRIPLLLHRIRPVQERRYRLLNALTTAASCVIALAEERHVLLPEEPVLLEVF